jgi:hypothetical protein
MLPVSFIELSRYHEAEKLDRRLFVILGVIVFHGVSLAFLMTHKRWLQI